MSSSSSSTAPRETRHAMKLRHKAELKALMNAPAKGIGAKKKQKEDAAALEAVHEEQLKELERKEKEQAASEETDGDATATSSEKNADDVATETKEDDDSHAASASASSSSAKQPSRAQKKKAAAAEKERQRMAEIREHTKNMADPRGEEDAAIAKHMAQEAKQQKLRVREMVSDGHCLYRAVADQVHQHHLTREVPLNDNTTPFMALRQLAAEYINEHRDEFAAFMLVEGADGQILELNDATWKKYLHDLVDEQKAVWGGHTEVVALSKVLQRPIIIWSADGKMEVGEEFRNAASSSAAAASSSSPVSPLVASPNSVQSSPSPSPDAEPLHISFHQHYYGLGAHYNSVVTDSELDAAEAFAAGSESK